ncbi:hypothetical protein [Rhodopseudomonas palustris]|uniref:hypothetical protein n=1 Tax=Rhodopseudomonas palustris TaxID=1076 RepID=UPI000CEC2656|nr:hypothetical protein [Rhodopseudomonas palustris]PPQ42120.1 hypothetical protein CKO39_18190 [Rhodopseudomonas palustris]
MCDCIDKINAELKPEGQCLDATIFGVRQVVTRLIRTDKYALEKRRGKAKLIVSTFCPFCGEKYQEASRAPAMAATTKPIVTNVSWSAQ